ncbi:MAG: molybdopterin-dependent oxidoreductase [Kofleriaceae bacterium]|nr:molybdopterin-dependent oxidoreductase [Kofleriaceae bacterium]MBP6837079.1 molybdopterin-dependent oxidoreductase [Kofleriaceae bacterium]MBP9202936.1 molybdopterin-dependent oxidoreductase [Kofleriaceae bacterium]
MNRQDPDLDRYPALRSALDRRRFVTSAVAGTALLAVGGAVYRLASDDMTRKARADKRADGRPRLPPGQRVIEKLRPMGGDEGPGDVKSFRLRVHGLVRQPLELDYAALLKLPQHEREADVHCVTGWSMLAGLWKGVLMTTLAEKAGMKAEARHVIFEAAHGYTANVPLAEATRPEAMITYRLNGRPFALQHGAPVRGLVPDLYFWKSAKWITGVRFVAADEPGYWEVRGYHNHADPWREERYG